MQIIPDELLRRIRSAFVQGKYILTDHAYERIAERKITPQELRLLVLEGEAIEVRQAPDDSLATVVLFSGHTKSARPLHVVVAEVQTGRQKHFVVTVYEPDLDQWESGFTIRRRGEV